MRVAQIVSNLVSNALTYSPPDSVVRVDVIADTEAIVVLVHNEGKAIPKDAQARIFEAFDRGAETNGHGLGLGLYIASHLARAHGGDIDVSSETGHGTTFAVRLPRS